MKLYSLYFRIKSLYLTDLWTCCLFDPQRLIYIGGEGWLEFSDLWSGQKPWRNWYLTPMMNFGEVRRTKLAKSTLLTSTLVPLGSFQIFLRSVQMPEREWGAESNVKLPHLFIPGKTEALVPEFAVEDLPSAELQPWFLLLHWRTCPWAEHSDDDDDDD